MNVCSKCKGTHQVTDGGLVLAEILTGGLIKANHPARIYPCPKCLPELHRAVHKEYCILDEKIKLLLESNKS